MTTVLVTDGDRRAALAIVRSLGHARYEALVVAPDRHSLAGSSRHAGREEVLPAPLSHPAEFAAGVARVAYAAGAELVLPVSEEAMLAVLGAAELFDRVRLPFGSLAAFTRASDKAAVLGVARDLGLRVPAQACLEGPDDAREPALRIGFPLVLKPTRSVSPESVGSKFRVHHAADPCQLEAALARLPAAAFPVLAQRRVIGPGTGVFVLMHGGQRVAEFAHRRIREKPPAGGVSVLAESIALDPRLAADAQRLLEALGWNGVAMVEFKRDALTGDPYVMEVNARFWGSLQLAVDAGVDFPRLLVDAALGRPVKPVTSYRVGVRTRWFWGDVDQLLARLRRSPEALSLPPGAPSRTRAVWDFLTATLDPRIRNEVCRWNDPLPAVRETLDWFRGRSA